MAESILRKKSYAFALKVIKVYKQIVAEKKEYVLSKQFLVLRFSFQMKNYIYEYQAV